MRRGIDGSVVALVPRGPEPSAPELDGAVARRRELDGAEHGGPRLDVRHGNRLGSAERDFARHRAHPYPLAFRCADFRGNVRPGAGNKVQYVLIRRGFPVPWLDGLR
ncbi:MAG TPA: hypothetical protein HPP77_09400 [Candidatus Hydrogenedentes bacterium]|nr:hypothetical protein [Candidatus Hydrogenedentota bacterium]